MRYLFADWDKLERVLNNRYILLFLDYDGTLTPIVDIPDRAVIGGETKELLSKLSRRPNCKLAIISGRALKDLKEKVGIEGLIYVGNHGAEIEGPKIKFERPVPIKQKIIFEQIKNELSNKLSKIKGTLVEDKGYGISAHYRLAQNDSIPLIKKIIDETIDYFLLRGKIKKSFGKRVFELRLPGLLDKGKIVLWLLARTQFISDTKKLSSIYVGDDVTDEDAFKVLKNKGLTIFVGNPKDSYAQYYLKDPQEVTEFLRRILDMITKTAYV